MQQKQINQIFQLLKTYRRKVVVFDTWNMIQAYLWIPAAITLGIQIAGRIWPITNLAILTLLPLVIFILSSMVYAVFLPKSDLRVAWRVDQNLKLKERISSGIAFAEKDLPQDPEALALLDKQREDALTTLKNNNPKNAFKLALSRKYLLIAGGLFVGAAVLGYLPNPMDEVLRTRQAVAEAAEAQAEQIEDLQEEIDNNEELSEGEKEALLRELEALAELLRENKGDLAEALDDISRVEQSLIERLDPNADFKQATLNSLTQQLTALAQQSSSTPEEITGLEEALEALAEQMGEMSEAEREAAAQSLQQMTSQAAQAGASSLAEALASLSQSVQSGSMEGAQQASQQVEDAISQSQSELTDQQSLESALAQLQESRQALSQSGQSGQTAQGQNGDQGNPGQGQSPGQGQTGSQGQGQGTTAGGGGGTNANNLPPSTGSGQATSPQGAGASGQAGVLEDQVYAPWERQQGENNPLSISGQDTGQGQTQVNEQDQPLTGINTGSSVPYRDVFQTYQDSAYETIEESYIPPSLKTYILEYFSQLEP
ncbi:hypothetical protein KQH54_03235 [bacterium]|nr:hypothetical protein [bacterium]